MSNRGAMKQYGLPYKGSKSALAERILSLLPPAETLYDVFAGGCAITHAAMVSNKFKKIVCNDITNIPELFVDAVNGKFRDCDRWVGRDEFLLFKNVDPFVAVVYSFGNDCKTYMYSREIEPYKRAIHRLLFAPTVNERMLAFRKAIVELKKIEGDTSLEGLQSLASLQRLQRLQSLESLQRLQSLESLQRLESLQILQSLQSDYRQLDINGDAVIYCDPPYKGTNQYTTAFNHEEFYEWCRQQTCPIYISEYSMPDDFECVGQWRVAKKMSAKGGGHATEKLYTLRR